MDIYKFYPSTKEWSNIVNSNMKRKEIDAALDKYIKENGEKVSIQDYFNDHNRNSFSIDYSYKCFGDATNIFERLAKGEIDYDNDLNYLNVVKKSPEDLIESRTDWDDMKSYADGLASFIDSLKYEIANGTIILK